MSYILKEMSVLEDNAKINLLECNNDFDSDD